MHFDAWANDLSDDPLLGFMSQLQASLSPYLKQLPLDRKARHAAAKKLKEVFKQAPRAVLPVATVLAKGLMKKLSGVDAEAVLEAAAAGDAEVDLGSIKELSTKALVEFFEVAMKSHNDKQSAILGLKTAIEELLQYLGEQEQVSLPMFVFIDELDRCRPDYAIRLLEGIKHLFDAQGVCFVFSTNLRQLSASAQAVYGQSFDAYRYLKRFFAFEYRLPTPDHEAYAELLAKDSVLATRDLRVCSALPGPEQASTKALSANFALVAKAFRLDLRSQKQVFRQAEAACSGLKDGTNLYCLYMFFLSAAYQRGNETYDAIESASQDTIKALGIVDVQVPYTSYGANGRRTDSRIGFINLILKYHALTQTSLEELLQNGGRNDEYPETIVQQVQSEVVGSYIRKGKPTLSSYFGLVRAGGQIVALRE